MTLASARTDRLLVDTNLLVLYAVGTVNRNRIEAFKRTSKYTVQDFDLLLRVLGQWRSLHTVPHVLAEVSNLTDLRGEERSRSREVLKGTISLLIEVELPSIRAAQDPTYLDLGLVDAAIATAAREHGCTVLTDDLDLYLLLLRDNIEAVNFTHLQAQEFGI